MCGCVEMILWLSKLLRKRESMIIGCTRFCRSQKPMQVLLWDLLEKYGFLLGCLKVIRSFHVGIALLSTITSNYNY